MTNMFSKHRECLLQSLDAAHTTFYRAATFSGPSLHFHLRALKVGKEADLEQFAESVYALLASWGMHRMGRGGSKMREFDEFKVSLYSQWPTVMKLQLAAPEDLDETGWRELGKVFCGIRCMATGTSLVGNSKVMAHALPNLVAPVDRQYTLRFLFGNTAIINHLVREQEKLQAILRHFFYPILRDQRFKRSVAEWQAHPDKYLWDTSPLKIIDNLIIGLLKSEQGSGA